MPQCPRFDWVLSRCLGCGEPQLLVIVLPTFGDGYPIGRCPECGKEELL